MWQHNLPIFLCESVGSPQLRIPVSICKSWTLALLGLFNKPAPKPHYISPWFKNYKAIFKTQDISFHFVCKLQFYKFNETFWDWYQYFQISVLLTLWHWKTSMLQHTGWGSNFLMTQYMCSICVGQLWPFLCNLRSFFPTTTNLSNYVSVQKKINPVIQILAFHRLHLDFWCQRVRNIKFKSSLPIVYSTIQYPNMGQPST